MSVNVDYATLYGAASDVQSTRQEMDGALNQLKGSVDMLATKWVGTGGTSFQNLMRRWQEETDKLLVAMDSIGEMLRESGTTHQVTDEQQQQELNKFTSAINP